MRFCSIGEPQGNNVEYLLDTKMEGRGELSINVVLAAADLEYGSLQRLKRFISLFIGFIMNMPIHLLRFHPFAPESCLHVTDDEETNAYYNIENLGANYERYNDEQQSFGHPDEVNALNASQICQNSVGSSPS